VLVAGVLIYRVRDERLREIAAADLVTKAKQLDNFEFSVNHYGSVNQIIPAYRYAIPARVVFSQPPRPTGLTRPRDRSSPLVQSRTT